MKTIFHFNPKASRPFKASKKLVGTDSTGTIFGKCKNEYSNGTFGKKFHHHYYQKFMPQGQLQAFLDPKDRPGGTAGGVGSSTMMGGMSTNEFMMAAAVSEYRSKQQLAQNLAASIAIKQDPGSVAAADADAQLQQQHSHHPQPVVGPFQNVCFNEPHGWDWNGYAHPNHNFHPIHHHHHQNEQLVLPDHASQLAPLPANSGGSSTNNNNSSGNSSPQNNGGTDSPPVAVAAAAANLQHPVAVPNLPQQPLQPEALLAAGPPPPPSHAHHLYYDQQVHQQYQYFQQYHQHHHQQYPIHHHQPALDQYGFQDQASHLNHHHQQQQQPELAAAALCFPTPPTEAGDLSHPPPPPATTSSSAAAAATTTLVKQEANVSPTGSCSGAKPKNWNNNRDTA